MKIYLLLAIPIYLLPYDSSKVDRLFQALENSKYRFIDIERVEDPFIKPQVYETPIERAKNISKETKEIELNLIAIFQNRANINGLWLKEGESIGKFKIERVDLRQVILRESDFNKSLELNISNSLFRRSYEDN